MVRVLKVLAVTVVIFIAVSCEEKREKPGKFPPVDLVTFRAYPGYISGEFKEKLHWDYGDNGRVYLINTAKVNEFEGDLRHSEIQYKELTKLIVNREFYQHYKNGFTIPVSPDSIFEIEESEYSPRKKPDFEDYQILGNVLVKKMFFPNGNCFFQGFQRSDCGFSLILNLPWDLSSWDWFNIKDSLGCEPKKLSLFQVCNENLDYDSISCYVSGIDLKCERYNFWRMEKFSFEVTTSVKDFDFSLVETRFVYFSRFNTIKFFVIDTDSNLWEYSYYENTSSTVIQKEFIASQVKYIQLNRIGTEQFFSYYLFPYFITGLDNDYLNFYDIREKRVKLLFKEDNVSLILDDVSEPYFEIGDEGYCPEIIPYRYDLWYVTDGRVLKHNGEVVAEFSADIVKGAVFRDLSGHLRPFLYLLFDNGKFMFWNLSDNPLVISFWGRGGFRKITDFSLIRKFPYRIYIVVEPGVVKFVSVGYGGKYFKKVYDTDVYEFTGELGLLAFSDISPEVRYYSPVTRAGHYYFEVSKE